MELCQLKSYRSAEQKVLKAFVGWVPPSIGTKPVGGAHPTDTFHFEPAHFWPAQKVIRTYSSNLSLLV
jgi:hypothetical protein